MNEFLLDALTFLLRWLHVVAAIAWIGESFYFVALDRGLKKPAQPAPGLSGESWSVHGGGLCTISDPQRFYSHRRDQRTGRMATLVWQAQAS